METVKGPPANVSIFMLYGSQIKWTGQRQRQKNALQSIKGETHQETLRTQRAWGVNNWLIEQKSIWLFWWSAWPKSTCVSSALHERAANELMMSLKTAMSRSLPPITENWTPRANGASVSQKKKLFPILCEKQKQASKIRATCIIKHLYTNHLLVSAGLRKERRMPSTTYGFQ